MEEKQLNILVVDPTNNGLQTVEHLLAGLWPASCSWLRDINNLLASAASGIHDLILLASHWPQEQLGTVLNAARNQGCDTPIILFSEQQDMALEQQAVFLGAADYLPLDCTNQDCLRRALRYAIDRKQQERHLNRLAYFDSLTGIANRLLFRDRLEHAIVMAERDKAWFALFYIDLNDFKQVNDRYGHDIGDELIRACAERLTRVCRRSDSSARIGGDEFVLLVENVDSSVSIAHIAEKVIHALTQPHKLNNHEVSVGCSVGIAVYPEAGTDADTLQRNADLAMYQAKVQEGSAYHFFTDAMGKLVKQQLKLEAQLRRACRQQEFCLHYQPRVDIQTGYVKGLEALVRWQHPVQGLMYPDSFIPLAESTGLIMPIGYWVIRQACMDMRRWLDMGLPPLTMAINLSVRQFKDERLVERIAGIFKEQNIDPRWIEFELTETAIMENIELVELCMLPLSHLGCKFALDDFGTGYSSFVQLQRLPISTIKLDKQFIDHMLTKEQDALLVKAMIELAHSLGKTVIAEGVEQYQQSNLLCGYGCDETQGFYFSKPLDGLAIEQHFGQAMAFNQTLAFPESSLN